MAQGAYCCSFLRKASPKACARALPQAEKVLKHWSTNAHTQQIYFSASVPADSTLLNIALIFNLKQKPAALCHANGKLSPPTSPNVTWKAFFTRRLQIIKRIKLFIVVCLIPGLSIIIFSAIESKLINTNAIFIGVDRR